MCLTIAKDYTDQLYIVFIICIKIIIKYFHIANIERIKETQIIHIDRDYDTLLSVTDGTKSSKLLELCSISI